MTQVIDDFVSITRRIISRDGFDAYLPTLLLPATKEVLVLEGAPNDASLPVTARRWAERRAGPEVDFVLAYKSDEWHFAVVARVGGAVQERVELAHAA